MNSYQIVLNGVMLAMDEQEVRQAFARLFKLSPEKAAAILAKPKTVLRSNLDAAAAEMYREKLLAIGVDVDVRDAASSNRLTGELEPEQVIAGSPAALTLEPLSLAVESGDYQPRYQGNRTLAIVFGGSRFAYWRIGMINILLSLLSFGLYSTWASERSRQYFYSHSALDGVSFQCVSRPLNLFLQRLLLVVWSVFCIWSYYQAPPLALAAAGSLLLSPLFLWWRTKGRYEAVVWRSVHLRLDANLLGLYYRLLLPVVLLACALGAGVLPALDVISQSDGQLIRDVCLCLFFLGVPYWHAALHRFFTQHTHCGDAYFSCAATAWDYYKLYFLKTPLWFLVLFAPLFVAVYLMVGSDPVQAITGMRSLWHGELSALNPAEVRAYGLANAMSLLLLLLVSVWLLAYLRAGVINLRINGLSLDKTVVACEIRARVLCWLYLSNAVLILLSAGLLIPFAVVRTMKYRLSCITVYASYDLDDVVTRARSSSAL